ncbi:MAG TPA: tryptophan--tRNA ligase, partial [Candidatus Nitrosotalea sp.]|nr:tryptophan--tRNA ligase [Candidatus Nitrosotalea sp.]
MAQTTSRRPRVMSGMRPTGDLHLGHLVGVLTQWANYCATADAFFEIADLHAYTTDFDDPSKIRAARDEMVAVWLAAGVNPERATIFLQSGVPEIGELQALLAMITPVSWLERVPTYKGQIEALGQKIATYGFLGYPLLQLCDIAIVRGEYVPVGRDQVAHL